MLFSSYSFLFYFLPALLVLYFLLPGRLRNYLLLAFSLGFYAWGGPKYLAIMLLSIAINYSMGLLVSHCKGHDRYEKLTLTLAVILNLGLLGYFKYANFFVDNVNLLLHANYAIQKIVLPIGISFYTFQGLSYVIDVKNGRGEVQRNPLKVALFISLFPQLIAGPIVRYETIAGQLDKRSYDNRLVTEGMERFVFGLSKKIIFANTFGLLADKSFILGTGELSIVTAWIGAIAYTLQIYYDFSGYSDMAIGLGQILGFSFPENFNYPYIAKSITDFWRRWHISLSTWFRDYVYIPLGGNRKGIKRQIFNMLVVWTLTGFWHGASWNFLIWGFYYAVLLIVEKLIPEAWREKLPDFVRTLLTMIFVIIGWVIFRAANLSEAVFYMRMMFDIHTNNSILAGQMRRFVQEYGIQFCTGVLFATPLIRTSYVKIGQRIGARKFLVVRVTIFLVLFLYCVMKLIVSSYNPFIYFRF